MERMFSESQVKILIVRAELEGKITATKYYLEFIDAELKIKEEWFDQLNQTEFMSERWIECNSSIQTLRKIQKELNDCLKLFEKASK